MPDNRILTKDIGSQLKYKQLVTIQQESVQKDFHSNSL